MHAPRMRMGMRARAARSRAGGRAARGPGLQKLELCSYSYSGLLLDSSSWTLMTNNMRYPTLTHRTFMTITNATADKIFHRTHMCIQVASVHHDLQQATCRSNMPIKIHHKNSPRNGQCKMQQNNNRPIQPAGER